MKRAAPSTATRPATPHALPAAPHAQRQSPWRTAALLTPAWLALGVFFLLPLGIMFIISFRQRGELGGLDPIDNVWQYIRGGDAFQNYRDSFHGIFAQIFWRSIWLAAATTAICLAISYPTAYYIARVARARWKNLLLGLVVIPFWTSFVVRTYAWMLILRGQGLLNLLLIRLHLATHPSELLYTITGELIGLVYAQLPFMILPLYVSLEKLDPTLLEAAGDLGAGSASAFWRVTAPLTMPGIVAGIVLVFIPSVGQFIVSDLLGGAKHQLIGNLIDDQFRHASDKPFGSALAFELTSVVVVMLLAYALYTKAAKQEAVL
jgi:spermidine/putrescine transport system permease protein